jgi:hypothetical protein
MPAEVHKSLPIVMLVARLMERLSELRATDATREALGKASGIINPAILERSR